MRTFLLYLLFFLSGTTALVYELVWVRQLVFVFGGTTYAITTVLVAFMAGLGLGSYLAGRWCYRLERPAQIFGILEIGIGLYALAVPVLLGLADPFYRAIYPLAAASPWILNAVRFGVGGMVVLLPATLMGATLPVLVRHVVMQGHRIGLSVGLLYGVNTIGAVLGVVLAGFVMLPALGLQATTRLSASVDVIVGVAALLLLGGVAVKRAAPTSAVETTRSAEPAAATVTRTGYYLTLVGYAVSGFAAMVYQITWTRALIMSVGSTTYAFTCILAAFILGLALGSLAIARFVDRWKNPVVVIGVLEILIGLIAVSIVPIHGQVPLWVRGFVLEMSNDYDKLMSVQFLVIIAITFVPTFLMGAIFPVVIRALAATGAEAGDVTGRAYAANTIGTITGAFLAGFVLIRSDVLGVQNSIILASLLNGAIGATLILGASRVRGPRLYGRLAVAGVGLLLIVGVVLFTPRWDRLKLTVGPFLNMAERELDRTIVYYAEGVDLTVTVEYQNDKPTGRTLTVNGKPDASTATEDMITMVLLGHLPTLMHGEARSACMIGLGSGISLAALARYPSLERLDCVEISEEVIDAARQFDPWTYNVLTDEPRVEMILADGRNHLLLTDRTYDLVITQPSNPWMSGVSNLFTREYFELGRDRLAEGGLMAVWLQGYKTSIRDFQMVVRTLFEVFPHVSLWELGEDDYLMLASREPQRVDLNQLYAGFEVPTVWADMYRIGIRLPAQVIGRYITSDDPLRAWVDGAPIHTDDNALLEFSAPRFMYTGGRHVARALYDIQRPVLADLLGPEDQPPAAVLQRDVDRLVKARWARILADEMAAAPRHDYAGALQLLLDRYRACPEHAELYKFIVETRKNLLLYPQIADRPDVAPLLAQIPALPPPRGAPITGATLSEIGGGVRAYATYLLQQQQPHEAALLLLEAQMIDPRGLAAVRELVDATRRGNVHDEVLETVVDRQSRQPRVGWLAYVHAILAADRGEGDVAVDQLRVALESRFLTRHDLAADERVDALRTLPEFGVLLGAEAVGAGSP